MADISPNQDLARKRLKVELSNMLLNTERMELRLMELDVERVVVEDNMVATKKRVTEIQEQMKLLGGN
jgi:hypothetical protein